jgi:uncharacterized protein YllA (UPF0747 family)
MGKADLKSRYHKNFISHSDYVKERDRIFEGEKRYLPKTFNKNLVKKNDSGIQKVPKIHNLIDPILLFQIHLAHLDEFKSWRKNSSRKIILRSNEIIRK